MTAPRGAGWWVVCPAYQRGPFRSAETAQREMGRIEALGACSYEHQIEEV